MRYFHQKTNSLHGKLRKSSPLLTLIECLDFTYPVIISLDICVNDVIADKNVVTKIMNNSIGL